MPPLVGLQAGVRATSDMIRDLELCATSVLSLVTPETLNPGGSTGRGTRGRGNQPAAGQCVAKRWQRNMALPWPLAEAPQRHFSMLHSISGHSGQTRPKSKFRGWRVGGLWGGGGGGAGSRAHVWLRGFRGGGGWGRGGGWCLLLWLGASWGGGGGGVGGLNRVYLEAGTRVFL